MENSPKSGRGKYLLVEIIKAFDALIFDTFAPPLAQLQAHRGHLAPIRHAPQMELQSFPTDLRFTKKGDSP